MSDNKISTVVFNPSNLKKTSVVMGKDGKLIEVKSVQERREELRKLIGKKINESIFQYGAISRL